MTKDEARIFDALLLARLRKAAERREVEQEIEAMNRDLIAAKTAPERKPHDH